MPSHQKQRRATTRRDVAAARLAGVGAIFLVLILAYSLDGRHSPTSEGRGQAIAQSGQSPAPATGQR